MAREYLKDVEFLKRLDEMRIRKHYVKLQIFNFQEKPLREIQGIATAGNVTVNGSSAVRRTINLTLVAPADENDLDNIDNIISANKKIKVEMGIENPYDDYSFYGDIVWFPIGYFLITEATSTTSATNATISLKGKDKMCLLDGTIGGVLPATIVFHEGNEVDEFGNVTVTSIPIFTIIKECVTFYGKEHESNIIINDVDMVAKQAIQYVGSEPVWFDEDFQLPPYFGDVPSENTEYTKKFIYGQDVGYMETDFTYPGELIFEAGSTVTEVLDKIIQTLGNYEYFYDLDGHFIFQEKKNYLNHYYTPITELGDYYYIKAFSDTKYHDIFNNSKSSVSYFFSPKYDNLKNDFVVWGTHTDKDGVTNNIKYHLAIDEKPLLNLAEQYMWDACDGNGNHMFYVFDYENKRYEEQNGPAQEPIEIVYNDEVLEEDLINYITAYINENYINYVARETSFILWVKVLWNKQFRYYQVKITKGAINRIIYDEALTKYVSEEEIVIGIRRPYEKEVEVDANGNLIIEPSNPDMDTENKFDDNNGKPIDKDATTWKKDEKENEIEIKYELKDEKTIFTEDGFKILKESNLEKIKIKISYIESNKNFPEDQIKDKTFTYPNDYKVDFDNKTIIFNNNLPEKISKIILSSNEKIVRTEIKTFLEEHFTALQIKEEEGLYYLGYYDLNNTWQKVYTLGEDKKVLLSNLSSILSSIQSDFTVRVFFFKDFNKNNTYNFDAISTVNLGSISSENVNPRILKLDDDTEVEFDYEFSDIEWHDVVTMTAEEREKLITELVQFYPDDLTNLKIDIQTVYNESQGNDLLPDYNPDMDTENKFDKNNNDIMLMSEETVAEDEEEKEEEGEGFLESLLKSLYESWKKLLNGYIEDAKEKDPNKDDDTSGDSGQEGDNKNPEEDDNDKNPEEEEKEDNDTHGVFKLINREQADLIYKYAQSGKTINDLLLELITYWGNVTIKGPINKEYILEVETESVIDPEFDYGENIIYSLIGKPCSEWREELYRQALLNQESAGAQGYYDSELLSFWRNNFDTMNEAWRLEWEDNFQDIEWEGWNPAIYKDPGLLVYWLDFIDNDQIISKYSVNQIGRRTKAISKENIKMLYKLEVPDVMFFENEVDSNDEILNFYWNSGQKYCALKKNEMQYFASSSTGSTAFDLIREILYQYLSFNTSVTINCIPKYYLEPNNVIYIRDDKSNIQGDYVITQYTVPLTYNGTMSINCAQTLTRV